MLWPRRLALALTTIAILCSAAPAAAAGRGAAQRLIRAYAPILMLREEQEPPCETSAEQYQPTSVSTMLGNPAVELTRVVPGEPEELVKKGPTAADIAGRGDEYHLDIPGDPLEDTCVYARDFARLVREGKAPAITYAHIAHQVGHSGLAVQYWFFWYFNQFNDVHEGDWEGMQIAFEAANPRAALRTGPSEMVLFQHAGGETADWEDAKVEKEGTHPVVYPAAGSHATFYDSTVYVENGQEGSGVGCDNTSEPLRRLAVRPIAVPTHPTTTGRFKWLTYFGHWGQEEAGFNNGPTGPVTKAQWLEPFTWMEGQRSTSPRLPGGSIVGPAVTGAFCGAVAEVSNLINLDAKSRPAALATIAVVAILLALFVGLTRWGPVDLTDLRRRRSFGQLVRTARRLYGRHWRVLVLVGLTAIPIVGGVNLLAGLVAGGRGVDNTAGRSGVHLALADVIEAIGRPIASAVVAAVVIVFIRQLAESAPAGFLASYRGMWQRFGRVVLAQLLATLAVAAMAISVIGLPFAVWKFVGWQFVQQEILFEDQSIRDAFRGSSNLVRERWWHTVRVAAFLWLIGIVSGPVIGFTLIFTNFSLFWINVIGSVVFALLVPYVAAGHTLLYFDLQARAEEAPAKRWRERLPRRTAAAEA
ncbi:MAG TPA: Vps62-related protein [Solirubrobacterales bacterium]|nr:Vps62-related protein [Solirubrobacterales bacterium]